MSQEDKKMTKTQKILNEGDFIVEEKSDTYRLVSSKTAVKPLRSGWLKKAGRGKLSSLGKMYKSIKANTSTKFVKYTRTKSNKSDLIASGKNIKYISDSKNNTFKIISTVEGKRMTTGPLKIGGAVWSRLVKRGRTDVPDMPPRIPEPITRLPTIADYVTAIFGGKKIIVVPKELEKKVIERLVRDPRRLSTRITMGRGTSWFTLNNAIAGVLLKGQSSADITDRIASALWNGVQGEITNEEYNPVLVVTGIGSDQPLKFRKIKSKTGRKDKASGFFKHVLHQDFPLDLSKYGIYKDYKDMNNAGFCIMQCLENCEKIEYEKLMRAKDLIYSGFTPKRFIKQLAEMCDICIKLASEGNPNKTVYGNPKNPVVNISSIDNHYFLDEKVSISRHSLLNWKDLDFSDEKNFKLVQDSKRGGRYKKNATLMSTHRMVKLLLDMKDDTLTEISIENLYRHDLLCKEVEEDELPIIDPTPEDHIRLTDGVVLAEDGTQILDRFDGRWVFDTETKVTKSRLTCNVFEYAELVEGSEIKSGNLISMINDMLDRGERDPRNPVKMLGLSHNMTFDLQVCMPDIEKYNKACPKDSQKIKITKFIGSVSKLVFAEIKVPGLVLTLRCSWRILSVALGKFGKCGLTTAQEKDVCPYGLLTDEKYKEVWIDLKEAEKDFKDELEPNNNYTLFHKNLEKLEKEQPGEYLTDSKFHLENYVRFYCKIDVGVLREGLLTFKNEWLPELNEVIQKVNPGAYKVGFDTILTCSNLAKQLYQLSGCFDGCFKINGLVRKFIEQCIVGGRVMTNKNEVWKVESGCSTEEECITKEEFEITNKKGETRSLIRNSVKIKSGMADFDCRSCYTSSMKEMADEYGGFLKGQAHKIPDSVLEIKDFEKQLDHEFTMDNPYHPINILKRTGVEEGFEGLDEKRFTKFIDMEPDSNVYLMGTAAYDEDLMRAIEAKFSRKVKDLDAADVIIIGARSFNKEFNNYSGPNSFKFKQEFKKGNKVIIKHNTIPTNHFYKDEEFITTTLRKTDGYFVRFEITKVGKSLEIPLLNHKNGGNRHYTNDMVGKTVHLDMINLKSLVTFHQIEGVIKGGYFFKDGRAINCGKFSETLYKERCRLKKEGNPKQNIYKLMLNSGYGFTIIKEHPTYTIVCDQETRDKILYKKFQNIVSHNEICEGLHSVEVKKPVYSHANMPHLGSEILSQSKVIMQRVMSLAQDLGIKILYTDTDSMQIPADSLDHLSERYKKKYGRVLIGSELSQFHSDYDDLDKSQVKPSEARKAWYIAKKIYHGDTYAENAAGDVFTGTHSKMKGISDRALRWESKQRNIEVSSIYQDLFELKAVTFDLINNGKKTLKLDYTKKFTVMQREAMTRRVSLLQRDETAELIRTWEEDYEEESEEELTDCDDYYVEEYYEESEEESEDLPKQVYDCPGCCANEVNDPNDYCFECEFC